MRTLDLHRARDRQTAARMVRDGSVIGASFGTVYGIIGDGQSPQLQEEVAQIKGAARIGRPLSACLPSRRFSQLLDPDQIHPAVRGLALDGHVLSRTLSSLAFVRAPIRRAVADEVPPCLISYVGEVPYLQSVDPGGLPGIRSLIATLWRGGVRFPAVSSMNRSGEREIVTRPAAVDFSEGRELPALVVPKQVTQRAQGSFSILEMGPEGVRAARHGVIPIDVLQRLIEVPIDDAVTEQAHYPPLNISSSQLGSLSHYAAARAVLLSLNTGLSPRAVRFLAGLGLSHPWPAPFG
jgi:hypothetical protein